MTTRRRIPPSETQPRVIGELQARLEELEAAAAEAAALRSRVAQLEADAEEQSQRYLRLAADFENYKKRARQDQLDSIQYGSRELLMRLLPVLDNFHRALEHAPADVDPNWLKGLELATQNLEEVLASQGVSPIEAVGASFDPTVHEALGSEESSQPEDTVVRELQRGYRHHGRVLRPALVKIARPPALPAAADID